MKERNALIDMSKGVLIILVTLGHIIQFITIGMGGERDSLGMIYLLLSILFICLHL